MSPKRLKRRHWYNITFVVQISHHSNRQGCSITMAFQNREVDIFSRNFMKFLYIYTLTKDTRKHGRGIPEEGWLVISEACMLAKWSDLVFLSGAKFGDTPRTWKDMFWEITGAAMKTVCSSSSSSSSSTTIIIIIIIITTIIIIITILPPPHHLAGRNNNSLPLVSS